MNVQRGAIQIGGSDQRTNVSIPGTFQIVKVTHIGSFRNPDGNQWCTVIEALGPGGEFPDTDPDAPNPNKDSQDATKTDNVQDPNNSTPPAPQFVVNDQMLRSFGSVVKRVPRRF
jgi:hypothetical protein